jgi:ABC-type multidrug transport system fused ATPase/permease subunit
MLTSSDNSRVIQGTFGQIVRLIKAVVIMFIAPFLLSISVVSINLINKEVLAFNNGYCSSRAIDPDSTENKTLAECAFEKVRVGFMNANEKTNIYTETKQLSKPPEAQIDWWDIGAYLQRFWNQFEALGTNIPTILLMLIILLLFMVIALQFVARFIQLYFLFALYPVVVCFWCHERTSSFGYSYIRQIATLLLQQPFFLLAFVIFQEVSLNLAGNMWNFSNLLIYAIFLGSLTVIPGSFAGRIFGDVGLFYANQNQNQNIYNKVMYKNQNQHRLEKPAKLAGKSLIKGIDTYKNFEDARSG